MHIPGFRILDLLSEHDQATVLRATRDADAAPVVLKVFAEHDAAHAEADLLRRVSGPGVPALLDLIATPQGPALVMEDAGRETVADRVARGRLTFEEILSLCVAVTRVVQRVHNCGVLHLDLKPRNVIVAPDPGAVSLVDFGLARVLDPSRDDAGTCADVVGTLGYCPPEQTGRTQAPVDRRSDLYGLGALIYFLAAGCPPFDGDDPIELVAATLSHTPTAVDVVSPWIPGPFAQLVARAIAKSPADRYQSAGGILGDLERCVSSIEGIGEVEPFELGLDDYRPLAAPPVDFGRPRAVEAIATQLDRGGVSVVPVRSAGDVAVPALVRAAVGERAFVVEATARAGARPLAPVRELVNAAARVILDAPRKVFDRVRASLAATVGDIGGVLLELAPAMERVLGPQPRLPDLGPAETRARLALALRHLSVGMSAVRPLVVVIDDAHQLDDPSKALLEEWTAMEDAGHLVVLGATDEPDATPLAGATAELRIRPLDEATLVNLVARTLDRAADEVRELAVVVRERCHANPVHMGEMLAHWARRDVLQRRDGRWTWDPATIERAPTPPSLGALMGDLVPTLDDLDRAALEVLACFGAPMKASALAGIDGSTEQAVSAQLSTLSQRGFLAEAEAGFWFAHPSVADAVREQIGDSRARALHTAIGRTLLLEPAQRVDAFTVADQLRRGEGPRSAAERGAFARAYLEAGRQSASATAFDDAVDFYERAIETANGADVGSAAFDAALGRARCLYMIDRGDDAVAALEALARGSLTPVQVAQVHGALADLAGARIDRDGAVDAILRGLERLGTKIPRRPSKLQTVVYLLRQERKLKRMGTAAIEAAPVTSDEVAAAKMQLVSDLLAPAYLSDANLFLYAVEAGLDLFMAHGRVPSLPFMLSAHAMVIRGALKKYARALEIQRAARALFESDPAPAWLAKFEVASFFTESLFDEPAEVIERLKTAGRVGLETGDTLFSAYGAHNAAGMSMWSGVPMAQVVAHFEATGAQFAGESGVTQIRARYLDALRKLMDGTSLSQADFDAIDALPRELNATLNDIMTNLASAMIVDGSQAQALRWIEMMLPTYEDVNLGYPQFFNMRMWQAIAWCDQLRAGKRRAGRRAASTLRWLQRSVAGLNPRFALYPALLEAELADARGRQDAAAAHFARAQSIALEAGQSDLLAYASERRARIAPARGLELEARLFLAEAHRAYRTWGHKAKTRALEAEFAWLSAETRAASRAGGSRRGESLGSRGSSRAERPSSRATASSTTSASLGQAMDLRTVLELSREIGTKVRLDDVVQAVLAGVATNVGARRAALIHMRSGTPVVLATRTYDAHQLVGAPVAQCAEVPEPAIDLVSRSGEALVVADARQDARLSADPGVVERGARSVACVPLKNQGTIVGFLYLESDLIEGAFTPDRLALVDMVSSQAAISLENAALYASLEARVASRTAELSARNEEMRVVLDNVTEGLVVLDRDGRLSSERSAVVDVWFDGEIPPTFSELLGGCDPEAQVWFDMGWEELVEGVMPLELCLDQLPARMQIGPRTLDLRWRAIADGPEGFSQLLVVMTDVTAELERQRTEAANTELMEIFARSQRDRVGYVEFVQSSRELVARLVSAHGSAAERFRWIHTLKGNCAVQGLTSVATACHAIESELAAEGRAPTLDEVTTIDTAWREADARIRTFVDTERDAIEVARGDLEAFLAELEPTAPELFATAHRWTLEPVAHRLASLGEQASALARRLGKGALEVHVDAGDLHHRAEDWSGFWQSFVHVVRNAVDHGLEEAGTRPASKGRARLELRAERRGDRFVISVSDDGRGIDWDALRERAKVMDLPCETREELVAAMFADGLSTRTEATETSGRGVGMAAVKAACQDLEGEISVDTTPGRGTTFVFDFPAARLGEATVRPNQADTQRVA